jgi:hypothetical protein
MEKVFLNQATQVFPSVSSVLAVFRIRIHVSESFKVSVSDSMTLGTQCDCPRGIFAWPIQITSRKPSPAVGLLQLSGYEAHQLSPLIRFWFFIQAPMLLIRIQSRIRRIRMFLGLPDRDPFVRGTDPATDPDPSNIKQK